jgi:uncharacterized cupredoxin-like copper-binding protein
MRRMRTRAAAGAIVAAAFVGATVAGAAEATPTATRGTVLGVTAGVPGEFHFKLSKASVPHGKAVTIIVTNRGNLPHDFKIAGKKTPLLQSGKTARLTLSFKKAGRYPYLCTVSGHAAAGMKGTLRVT